MSYKHDLQQLDSECMCLEWVMSTLNSTIAVICIPMLVTKQSATHNHRLSGNRKPAASATDGSEMSEKSLAMLYPLICQGNINFESQNSIYRL